MANGGWEFGTASGKLQGKIDWSSSSNGSSANTSNITAILYARRVDGYTTKGQSWSGYVKIQGKDNSNQTNISFDHSVSVGGSWVEMARVTLYNAKHNDDGSGSATVSGSVTGPSGTNLSGITSSGSSGITLDKIARYTNITNFSVDKRDETSFTFNWQTSDTIDYAWYSTNNGSNWTGVDVADGTSGSFAVTGLSIGGTYNCKLRVRRKDSQLTTDSGVVSKTTNTRPTSQVTGTSETTMTVKWTSDGTSNHIWYSLNNGSWVDVGNVNATTGTYTVSGLSQGTTYNVKTLVRKSNTSGQYESANAPGTTYKYPYCTEAPNFTINNSVTIKFYNPLNRSLQIQMYSHVLGDFVTDLITIGQVTQYTFTPNASRLYSSIPNNQSSKYNIDVWYNNHKEIGDKGTSYSINTSNIKPGFSNFAYKDVGTSALTTAIANNQIIVQGVSNVNLVISSANKMTPSKNASACTSSNSKYVATFDNLSKTQAYSDNDIDVNMGIPTGNGSKVFTVTAYDSRNIPNSIPKTIDIKPYSQPEVNPSLERLNGFETATTFSVAGTFSPVTVDNTDKNLISSIQYRYKESSSSTWGAWTAMTIDSQGSGVYQTTSVTLQCNNEKQFDFQFEVTDLARTVTVSRTLSVGVPLMMLHTNGDLDVQRNINAGGTTISKINIRAQAVVGNDEPNGAGWYKICESTMSGYGNTNVMWIIKDNYGNGQVGILNLEMRSNNGSIQCWNLQWVARRGFGSDLARIVINNNTWTLYFYRYTYQYGRISFHELYSNDITGATNYYPITYYNSTTKESTEPTATVTSSDGFTVNYSNSTGSLTRSLGNGTIPQTTIMDVSGSTDGLQLTYEAGTSDVGVSKLYTTDDADARLELGNNVSGTYKRAFFIQNGQAFGNKGGSWIKDRDNAIIRQAYVGNGTYAPCICVGTLNGCWTIGNLSDSNNLTFNYTTDTNYSSGTNTSSAYTLSNDGYFSGRVSIAYRLDKNTTFDSTGQARLVYNDGYGFNTSASNNGWSAPNGDWWQILHMPLSVNDYYNDMCFAVNSNDLFTRQRRSGIYSGWQQILQGKSLYNNSSGTSGTVTLSESASNFKYIEVFYNKNGTTGLQSVKVFTGHSMDDISCIMGYRMNDTSTQIGVSRIKISGTSITHISNGGVNLYSNRNPETFTGNELVIKRVDGWR